MQSHSHVVADLGKPGKKRDGNTGEVGSSTCNGDVNTESTGGGAARF
jgi:hypothetical protein